MTQNNNYRQQQINCIKTQFIQTVVRHAEKQPFNINCIFNEILNS